jgi:hypothetical protein
MKILKILTAARRRMNMQVLRIQANPTVLEAIRWESNEPEIREFVGNDRNLRFKDTGLEVWNKDTKTWENCPVFSFIVKGTKGELFTISPELFEKYYSIIE